MVDESKEFPYFYMYRMYFEDVMILSKLTSKAQTTIPAAVREALGLKPGDEVAYEIEEGRVILTRLTRRDTGDDPFATFEEWASTADERAYADL